MAAVELKALPWQHVDPSSIILGPEIKLENRSVKKKNKNISFCQKQFNISLW